MKHVSRSFAVLFLGLALVACQEPPTAQLTLAEQALSSAQQAEASTYAGPDLTAAESALAAAKAEVEAQNKKFALFRKYEEAGRLITEAQSKADATKVAAVAAKGRAREEAEASLAKAEQAVLSAGEALAELSSCTPYPKGFAADLAVMQGRVDGLDDATQPIHDAIQSEQYFSARDQAEAFLEQVRPLMDDMTSVKSKLRCRVMS